MTGARRISAAIRTALRGHSPRTFRKVPPVRGNEASVRRDAPFRIRRHAEFAHAEVQVVAAESRASARADPCATWPVRSGVIGPIRPTIPGSRRAVAVSSVACARLKTAGRAALFPLRTCVRPMYALMNLRSRWSSRPPYPPLEFRGQGRKFLFFLVRRERGRAPSPSTRRPALLTPLSPARECPAVSRRAAIVPIQGFKRVAANFPRCPGPPPCHPMRCPCLLGRPPHHRLAQIQRRSGRVSARRPAASAGGDGNRPISWPVHPGASTAIHSPRRRRWRVVPGNQPGPLRRWKMRLSSVDPKELSPSLCIPVKNYFPCEMPPSMQPSPRNDRFYGDSTTCGRGRLTSRQGVPLGKRHANGLARPWPACTPGGGFDSEMRFFFAPDVPRFFGTDCRKFLDLLHRPGDYLGPKCSQGYSKHGGMPVSTGRSGSRSIPMWDSRD